MAFFLLSFFLSAFWVIIFISSTASILIILSHIIILRNYFNNFIDIFKSSSLLKKSQKPSFLSPFPLQSLSLGVWQPYFYPIKLAVIRRNNDQFKKSAADLDSGSYSVKVEWHSWILVTLSTLYFLFVYLNY